MKGQLRSPSAAWRPDSPASTRKGPGRGQSQELVVVQLEIRAADGGTQKPGIVPVGETEVQSRFAGDRHPDSFVEGRQIERFDGPQRMAHRPDAGGIHLGQALQQVNPAHGVPQHLMHAEGLRMPLLEARHGLQEVAGVLPQEATRAKDHQAAASQLQADLLLLGAVDPRHQIDGEAAGGMQDHHSRPPLPPRGRRRQQVAFHPNTGLGVVANQLPHQRPRPALPPEGPPSPEEAGQRAWGPGTASSPAGSSDVRTPTGPGSGWGCPPDRPAGAAAREPPAAAWRAAAAPHPATPPRRSRRGPASMPRPARPGPPGRPPQTSGAKPRRSPRSLPQ